jgi:hypothetical protein
MYFINHVPFTFDELPESASSSEKLMRLADQQLLYTTDDLYRSSYYLILEECHPLMFDLDLKNPEDLPKV